MPDTARSTMKISHDGLVDLERREGRRNKVYPDSQGRPTIGVGHLLVGPWDTDMEWSNDDIDQHLAEDLDLREQAINELVTVGLTQSQFDSLVSFVFNIGVEAFKESTLLRLLNEGNYRGAAEQFLAWKKQPELLGRRQEERAVFLYGTI